MLFKCPFTSGAEANIPRGRSTRRLIHSSHPLPPVRSAVLDEQTKQCSQSGTLSRFELTTPESWPRVWPVKSRLELQGGGGGENMTGEEEKGDH